MRLSLNKVKEKGKNVAKGLMDECFIGPEGMGEKQDGRVPGGF